jgi:FtsP/CotA-like multicopper oxidase with cupredoxin domain
MKRTRATFITLVLIFLLSGIGTSEAEILVQCPCFEANPVTGNPDPTNLIPGAVHNPVTGNVECVVGTRNIACKHLAAGDGFINNADGSTMFIFGFTDVTGIASNQITSTAVLKSDFPAPTIVMRQGQEFYLTLTNVGFMMRPDLFDHHTVHFHGFPNASAFFDGEPMSSFGPNMGASITYFYKLVEPGTFMYHCHVEATEHMQMGMLGNLYVTPAQDGTTFSGCTTATYAYNDGDGSTCYDVAYPIQMHAADPDFHEANLTIQPLDFGGLDDKYAMLNGRGYPDTINPAQLGESADNMMYPSQKVSSLITANAGQKILLRISNLSFDFYTLSVLGIPMQVVGKDAKLLRGPAPANRNLYYTTNSIILGGGQTADVILDTTGISAGRYFLYTTNLNYLSNNAEERGGMMTEIVIN